jgi:membrane protein YqaA with SNARE-associated domain
VLLITLFLSGFTSATLFPGSSEGLFLLMLSQQNWSTGLLIVVVGTGNTLGGMSNWILGVLIDKGFHLNDKWSLNNTDQAKNLTTKTCIKAEKWLKNHGAPILFFSFLPIIGDPLCVVAGLLKMQGRVVLWYIALGKFFRYTLLSILFYLF